MKGLFLQYERSWKEEGPLFSLKVIVIKIWFKKLSSEIPQELLQTTLKFILYLFHYFNLFPYPYFVSWLQSCTVKYISQEFHIFNFSYLHIEPEPDLIIKNISSLANLKFTNQIWIYKIKRFCILNS